MLLGANVGPRVCEAISLGTHTFSSSCMGLCLGNALPDFEILFGGVIDHLPSAHVFNNCIS